MSNTLVKYFLLVFPVASSGLGYWQIKRLDWKKKLIADLERQVHSEPVDILSIDSLDDLKNFEYRQLIMKGRFDPDPNHQIYLKPRGLIANDEALMRGRTAHQSNIGVNVITPFSIADTNLRILVNRGWLATKGNKDRMEDSAHIGLGTADDPPIELIGIYRKSDNSPRYGAKNDETLNIWQFRDIEAMARLLKTAPIFVDAVQNKTRQQGPIGGQTSLNVRNEHLNYAITWFSLSALSFLMWYGKYGKRNFFVMRRRR